MKVSDNIKVNEGGERLDVFLARGFNGIHTRSRVANAIKDGSITLNGKVVKAGAVLRTGDVIEVLPFVSEPTDDRAEDVALDIIFQDEHLLIINKPRGMVVHPGAGNKRGTLLNALLGYQGAKNLDRAGIVHRLDKNTAGLMLAAKTPIAQAKLGEMFERHEVNRTYVGLVEGVIKTQRGTINANIVRDERNRTLYKTDLVKGRRAITHYKVLQAFSKHTLVEFTLETGRTHQIRVHCKSIGHPIVGDPEYNPKSSIKFDGQLLESVRIEFIHPVTQQNIKHEIALSKEFSTVIAKFV